MDNLYNLISDELKQFKSLNQGMGIVPNSIPILWFGDFNTYKNSKLKVVTVSLNPSDKEFSEVSNTTPSVNYRFPVYNNTIESLFKSYNEYFITNPYNAWFKASFNAVLEAFSASLYPGAINTAIHTDIGSPYATNPTWSKLDKPQRSTLESLGLNSWHNLIKIICPDVILFSASKDYHKKISFSQIGKWREVDVKAKRPLLIGKFKISPRKETTVLFQVQGRKPFLQTSKEEKLKFNNYL